MIEGVTFLVDDADPLTADSAAAAFRMLAEASVGRRSVAVIGGLAIPDGDDPVEEHDRIGRLAVRLGIGLLVAVGTAARHIQSAAGLEGSWDGESVIVADSAAAYDLLRELLRPGDVVLLTAAFSELAQQLAEVDG